MANTRAEKSLVEVIRESRVAKGSRKSTCT
jgi:hypothetical protein